MDTKLRWKKCMYIYMSSYIPCIHSTIAVLIRFLGQHLRVTIYNDEITLHIDSWLSQCPCNDFVYYFVQTKETVLCKWYQFSYYNWTKSKWMHLSTTMYTICVYLNALLNVDYHWGTNILVFFLYRYFNLFIFCLNVRSNFIQTRKAVCNNLLFTIVLFIYTNYEFNRIDFFYFIISLISFYT